MAMSRPGPADLADQLHRWAADEMHFRPQGRHVGAEPPTTQELQSICRGQQMQDIWKFVLERVRSAQTVRTVQGNLTLKRRSGTGYRVKYGGEEKYSEQRAELVAQRKALLDEVTAEKTAASHAEREIERLRAEVATTDRQYEEVRDRVQMTHRKCALLAANSQQVDEDAVRYKEYAQRMTDKAETLTRHGDEHQLFCRQGGHDGEKTMELETACTRAVRESCDAIADFLHNLLKGKYSADNSLMYHDKERLWQTIELNLTSFPPSHVVSSLAGQANASAVDLREKTAKINIMRDAETLKFKYENGRLRDTASSNTNSLIQSVQQLVTERQGVHLQRFVETEKNKNETWRLQERLSGVMGAMEDALLDAYHGDQGAMELAKNLFETEVELSATRKALSVLDKAVDRLMGEIAEASREKEALYTKYQKIQDFKKLADSKQNLIRVLVKQNASARSRLELQREEIVKYVDNSLSDHEGTTRSLTQDLRDTVVTEVNAFAQLSLPFLMYSLLDSGLRLAVLDLSIHRLSVQVKLGTSGTGQSGNQLQILQKVLTALEFPPYKAPECLLPKVLELQQSVEDLESTLATQEALVRNIEGKEEDANGTANWERFQDLCGKVREHDQHQLTTLLPVLQQRLARATQSLTDCLRLKDTAHDWWEQPAQTGTPWVKVDGMNLQQWHDKWTLAVTRLRQVQMAQS